MPRPLASKLTIQFHESGSGFFDRDFFCFAEVPETKPRTNHIRVKKGRIFFSSGAIACLKNLVNS